MRIIIIGSDTDIKAATAIRDTALKYGIDCTDLQNPFYYESTNNPYVYPINRYRELERDISRFSSLIEKCEKGDLTSYVPRFGTFNKFLWINPSTIHDRKKPGQRYKNKVPSTRKCFMTLKTYQNIRRSRRK